MSRICRFALVVLAALGSSAYGEERSPQHRVPPIPSSVDLSAVTDKWTPVSGGSFAAELSCSPASCTAMRAPVDAGSGWAAGLIRGALYEDAAGRPFVLVRAKQEGTAQQYAAACFCGGGGGGGGGGCTPRTTCAAGQCGVVSDGCSGSLDCGTCCGNGTCDLGESCADCVADCGPCCGNGACDPGEECDFCPGDCFCFGCPHDACTAGEALSAGCGTCAAAMCAVDSYCCDVEWDDICVSNVPSVCERSCSCGDGVCGQHESCATCAEDCGDCVAACDVPAGTCCYDGTTFESLDWTCQDDPASGTSTIELRNEVNGLVFRGTWPPSCAPGNVNIACDPANAGMLAINCETRTAGADALPDLVHAAQLEVYYEGTDCAYWQEILEPATAPASGGGAAEGLDGAAVAGTWSGPSPEPLPGGDGSTCDAAAPGHGPLAAGSSASAEGAGEGAGLFSAAQEGGPCPVPNDFRCFGHCGRLCNTCDTRQVQCCGNQGPATQLKCRTSDCCIDHDQCLDDVERWGGGWLERMACHTSAAFHGCSWTDALGMRWIGFQDFYLWQTICCAC